MVDLYGADKGNISLPEKLQSYEDEDQKAKPTIINLQKAFYGIKITDLVNRINRLEERNDELLEEIENTDEHSATVDAETAEEIANLNKLVTSQNNSIESLKSRIDTLENNRIEDKRAYEEKTKLFHQNYKKKKVELVSQIKALNARINVLEDFKKVQNGLKEKLEANEGQMIENEKKVKETMKIIDRKIEFNKEILKNEMYDCLLDLAAQFQLQTNKRISKPNQRLMRENILLKNELLQISEQISSKIDAQVSLKNSAIEYKKKINARSSFMRENLVISKVQHEVLKHLRKMLQKLQSWSINDLDPTAEGKYLMLIEKARQEQNNVNFRLSSLKTLLHKERTKVSVAKYLLKRLGCKIKALVETIYDVKYTVLCLLKSPNSRKDLITLSCIELFLFLRDLLVKGESKFRSYIIKSSETIPQELISTSHIMEIPEDFNFEITADFVEKELAVKEILDKTDEHLDEEEEIFTESSILQEEIVQDIVEDTVSIDVDLRESYEVFQDDEYAGESYFDDIEE